MENQENPEIEALEVPTGEEGINPIVDWKPGPDGVWAWTCSKCGERYVGWGALTQANLHEQKCQGTPGVS